jgi:hypothetical protein
MGLFVCSFAWGLILAGLCTSGSPYLQAKVLEDASIYRPRYSRMPLSTGQGTRGCLYLQAQVLEESRHGLPEVPRPVDGGMLARGLQVCAGQHVTQGNV